MAATVEIVIEGRDEFSGPLGAVTSSLSDFGNIITGIQSAFSLVGDALDTIITPIIDFGQEAVLAAARVSELQVVNQILGENAGISAEAVTEAAAAVRSMGIEAGISESVVAAFIGANLDLAYASDIARIAQDAAVIAGQNSSETLANIVYGIETLNPLVLRHAGIIIDSKTAYDEFAASIGKSATELTTAEKQQALLNAVMEEGETIAGAYAAAMEEPGKVLRSFPRYFDDILVAVGQPFQDAFGSAIFAIAGFLKELGNELGEGGSLRPALIITGEIMRSVMDAAISLIGNVDWDTIGASLKTIASDAYTEWIKLRGIIFDIATAYEDGGIPGLFEHLFGDVNPQSISDWLDGIDAQLAISVEAHDWTASGAAFGDMIEGLVTTNIEGQDSTAVPAIGAAINEWFLAAMGVVSWGEVWTILDQAIIDGWDNLGDGIRENNEKAREIYRTFFDGLDEDFNEWAGDVWQGFIDGLNDIDLSAQQWVDDHIINPIKRALGIASPSTVFMDIGRNIIAGLMYGLTQMINPLIIIINSVVQAILAPFAPILALLGIDVSSFSIPLLSTGTTGTTGGTTGTTTGTLGGTVVNQYFSGATINVGSWDEIAYDCQYPNPFIGATSGQLGTGGSGATSGGGR